MINIYFDGKCREKKKLKKKRNSFCEKNALEATGLLEILISVNDNIIDNKTRFEKRQLHCEQ